jgi:hypothetical protein
MRLLECKGKGKEKLDEQVPNSGKEEQAGPVPPGIF